ncbi:MAG: hypothetical protein IGS50_12980 [Synechococcales cyanobacterium C42_A2020_086]|nr:hypothetical protein [Synechococcales cyanobacterium C42_A2020_086]
MHVLILGNAADAHAAHIHQVLEQRGVSVAYWDTQQFPSRLCLSWQPGTRRGSLRLPNAQPLPLTEIHSVFWRSFSGVWVPQLNDPRQQVIATQDAMSALRSLMQACPGRWVNSWQAYQFHQEKPLQLGTAQQLGVAIPATLISNDPIQVSEFAQRYKRAIFKPVYGGAHTQWLTADHLNPERLRLALSLSPVTLQEYIPGTNIRTYVIGNTVYAAEIRSDALDFREDEAAQLLPLDLPDAVWQQCLAIAQAFFLTWTAIDWRRTPTGDYVFLEANPSPMFLHFEQQTGFPITDQLVALLTA